MARHRTSPIEDVIMVVSKLPWWAGVTLALMSYVILHVIASRPPLPVVGPGQAVALAVRSFYTTLAMFGQFVLPFVFGLGALISAIKLARQRKLYNNIVKRSGVGALNEISWGDFELLVSEFYRRKGFDVSREGGSGPDGGIDLVLRQKGETYLVQCKQWKAYKVGVQPVREFYGVMASRGAAGGYFVTSGEYTDEAKAFAQGLNLELIDGQTLRTMIDVAQQPVLTRVSVSSPLATGSGRPNFETDPVVEDSRISPIASAMPVPPVCPQCTAEMVKRVARYGSQAGKEFWGCVSYPKCKGTRPLEEPLTAEAPASVVPEPIMTPPALGKRKCPDCGSELVLRQLSLGHATENNSTLAYPARKGGQLVKPDNLLGC